MQVEVVGRGAAMPSCRRGAAWWHLVAGSFPMWVFGLRGDQRDEATRVCFEFNCELISIKCGICEYLGFFYLMLVFF